MTNRIEEDNTASFSYLSLAALLLRKRRLIVQVGTVCAVLAAGWLLTRPRTYTAQSRFTTQSRRMPGGLSGVAAQLGLSFAGLENTQGPPFFEALLRSRDIVDTVLLRSYPSRGGAVTLLDFSKVKGATGEERLLRGEHWVLDRLATSFDPKTGLITLWFTAGDPLIVADVNHSFVEQLNQYNSRTRQSQATAEREFTEQRLSEVGAELKASEERLLAFVQSNRGFRQGTGAELHEQRLRRDLAQRQQIYGQLAQAVEQARIDEVRDTPVISVVEHAQAPPLPDRRGLVSKTLLAFLLGSLLVCVGLVVRQAAGPGAGLPEDELAELRELRKATWHDLRRPWRLLGFPARGN